METRLNNVIRAKQDERFSSPADYIKALFATPPLAPALQTALGDLLFPNGPTPPPVLWVNLEVPESWARTFRRAKRMYPVPILSRHSDCVAKLHEKITAEDNSYEKTKSDRNWFTLSDLMGMWLETPRAPALQGSPRYFLVVRDEEWLRCVLNWTPFKRSQMVVLRRVEGDRYMLRFQSEATPEHPIQSLAIGKMFWMEDWLRTECPEELRKEIAGYVGIEDGSEGKIWLGLGKTAGEWDLKNAEHVTHLILKHEEFKSGVQRAGRRHHDDAKVDEALWFYGSPWRNDQAQWFLNTSSQPINHDDPKFEQRERIADWLGGLSKNAAHSKAFLSACKALFLWHKEGQGRFGEYGNFAKEELKDPGEEHQSSYGIKGIFLKLFLARLEFRLIEISDNAYYFLPLVPGLPFLLAIRQFVVREGFCDQAKLAIHTSVVEEHGSLVALCHACIRGGNNGWALRNAFWDLHKRGPATVKASAAVDNVDDLLHCCVRLRSTEQTEEWQQGFCGTKVPVCGVYFTPVSIHLHWTAMYSEPSPEESDE